MQTRVTPDNLPGYDAALLLQEMDLFETWFLNQQLGIELNQSQSSHWDAVKQILVNNAIEQPQVFVHRDFHSRNLMKLDRDNPGILDFQDAVKGPITYDLVSLLRDCYIAWPVARVEQLALDYFEFALVNQLVDVKPEKFMRWFNLMGIQRQLKAIGIFSRLNLRDGKASYLKDIPRTLNYITQVSVREVSVSALYDLVTELELGLRVKVFQ
jgi:aminoglycoside/choline kinase family phosphotransferase